MGKLPTPATGADEAREFLRLLEDVGEIQRDLLEEAERLRARVEELEAGKGKPPRSRKPKRDPQPPKGRGRRP